jgi:hypothetical protein
MFCPHDLAQARVAADQLPRGGDGERIDLLEAGDRDVSGGGALFVTGDVEIDLARAEDEPSHIRAIDGLVVEQRLERAVREVVQRRRGLLQAKQPLRRHHDERPRHRLERLPSQQVEVLRRRRAVRDADVLLRGELQEAFEPRTRVFRAVALVPVRQQQGQP